jgi:signal transduction histidine kinase
VETTSKTIRDPETGTVKEIIAVTRDIEERKKAEAELEKYRHRLEDFVLSRIKEQNKTVRIGSKKYNFLTVKFPLLDLEPTEEQVDFINDIKNAAKKMLSTVNDLILLSDLEKGDRRASEEPFSIRSVIEHTGAFLEEKKGTTVRFFVPFSYF